MTANPEVLPRPSRLRVRLSGRRGPTHVVTARLTWGLVLWQCPDQLTGGNWTLARSMIDQLLFRLPDLPKWVGLRSMLPERKCEVLEFRSEPLRAIVRSTQLPLSCIVGNPAGCELESLVSALAGEADILAEPGNSPELRPALAGWATEVAVLHVWNPDTVLPTSRGVRLMTALEEIVTAGVSESLRRELQLALENRFVVATFVQGKALFHSATRGL